MKRFFMVLFFLSALGATGARAEKKSGTIDNPRQIPDSIIISANRSASPAAETGSSITVITEEEIRLSQAGMVADLLRQVPGIDVVSSGGIGTQTAVYMRGANSHHTLVVIDGIEMNDPSSPNSGFDFAHLNIANIQRIEVLRGAQSVLYGSDAIGGVIQIFTKRGIGDIQADIVSEAGSYNSFSETVHISGNKDIADYSIFLSKKDSDGFSVIKDGSENDGYENFEYSGLIGLQVLKNYELKLVGKKIEGKADLDQSFGVADDPNFRTESDITSSSVKLQKIRTGNYFNPVIGFSSTVQNHSIIDETDTEHLYDASRYASEGVKGKFEIQNNATLYTSDRVTQKVNIGIETEVERYESSYSSKSMFGPYGDTVDEVSSRTTGLFLLHSVSYGKSLYVTTGIRFDNHEQFGDIYTFRLTGAYLLRNQGISFKANYGTGFKSPSLYQIHHPVYGNENLDPEKSKSWEIGVEKHTVNKELTVGATFFHNDFDKLFGIDAVTYQAINIDKVRSRGLELFSQFQFSRSSMRIDYTYTDIDNINGDESILRRPSGKFVYTIQQQLSEKLFTKFSMISVDDRVDVDYSSFPSNEVALEGYTVVNLMVSYAVLEAVQVTGRVENLFDEKYEEIYQYNTPGRSFYGGLRVRL